MAILLGKKMDKKRLIPLVIFFLIFITSCEPQSYSPGRIITGPCDLPNNNLYLNENGAIWELGPFQKDGVWQA